MPPRWQLWQKYLLTSSLASYQKQELQLQLQQKLQQNQKRQHQFSFLALRIYVKSFVCHIKLCALPLFWPIHLFSRWLPLKLLFGSDACLVVVFVHLPFVVVVVGLVELRLRYVALFLSHRLSTHFAAHFA